MMRRVLAIAAVIALLSLAMAWSSAPAASDNNDSSSSSATGPDINAKGEGKLNIVDWEGYADPSFVKGFEKETGCKVNDTFAGTSDEMFTKFRSGGGGQYDLASFSGDASLRAIKSGVGGRARHVEADELQRPGASSSSRRHSTPRTASSTDCRSCGARTS